MSEASSLHRIFNPRSVAFIGISRNPDSFGYPLLEITLRLGYTGKVFLVNPKADEILGLPCHDSLEDIEEEIDLALIMLPRKLAGIAISQCIHKRVRGIVMITAGFAEKSEEGRKHQEQLITQATEAGIRVIGPNTLGFFSSGLNLDVMMSGFIPSGEIGLITQSGNLTMSLTFPARERGLGFRYVVDLGNQADLQIHEVIRFFREDPDTRVIAVHIEGLRDGRAFLEEVRATTPHKPVVILKSGRTEAGARMVASHTASLAGDDAVFQAALQQSGAIGVTNFTEFQSVLLAFQAKRFPQGNRVCVISEGGGDCALTSDACLQHGLSLPELAPATQERIQQVVPPTGSVRNPVDLAGWESVVEATESALEDENIDGVIIVGGFAGFYHISPRDREKEEGHVQRFIQLWKQATKPILIYSYFGFCHGDMIQQLQSEGVPFYLDHHDAVRAMAALLHFVQLRQNSIATPDADDVSNAHSPVDPLPIGPLLESEAHAFLQSHNFPGLLPIAVAKDPQEAAKTATQIKGPVVAKILSRQILHKSDCGGVELNLQGETEIQDATERILQRAATAHPDATIEGVLLSPMANEPGTEFILGGLRDPVFGPVVALGIGGTMVEVLKDVAFRVCPVNESEARDMIDSLRGSQLLDGFRGSPPGDRVSLIHAITRLSTLLIQHSEIGEIDLNPVLVHEFGISVLDARILTHQENSSKS